MKNIVALLGAEFAAVNAIVCASAGSENEKLVALRRV
jgi:hypothetical protein